VKPSNDLLNAIKALEGYRPVGYLPTPHDVPTIGWGSTGSDIKVGTRWTEAQCQARFDAYNNKLANQLTSALEGTKTTQHQFDAMFDLAYNIGIGHFLTSSVLRDHRAKNYAKTSADFMMWIKQAGKVLGGLVARRKKEVAIYNTAD
jgi:lysozyme